MVKSTPPPAGWYPDHNDPSQAKWWDGNAWTEHRKPRTDLASSAQPVQAASDRASSGSTADEAHAVTSATQWTPASSKSAAVCPVCHESDAVQRASVVIDSGLSATAGTAYTVTLRGNIAATDYKSSTSTALAARIGPPPRPSFPFKEWFILLWIAGTVLCAWWFAAESHGGFINFMVGLLYAFAVWLPALIVTFIAKAVRSGWYARQGAEWDQRTDLLRSAYYCVRDDVMFSGNHSARPEAFKATIFPSHS